MSLERLDLAVARIAQSDLEAAAEQERFEIMSLGECCHRRQLDHKHGIGLLIGKRQCGVLR